MNFAFYSGCREMILSRDYEAMITFMKKEGFTHYEPLENVYEEPLFESIDDAKAFRALMEENGFKCACVSVFVNVYPDAEWAKEKLFACARTAAALGSPFIHHTNYVHLELKEGMPTYDELIERVEPAVCEVVRYAKSLGVTAIYEPQGMYFNGIDDFFTLFNRLRSEDGCENIGICFDFGNTIFADCMPYDFLKEALPYIKHAHFKDYKFVSGKLYEGRYYTRGGTLIEDVEVGAGDMAAEDCMRLLAEGGYKGVFSTESVPKAGGLDAYSGGAAAIRAAKMYNERLGNVW